MAATETWKYQSYWHVSAIKILPYPPRKMPDNAEIFLMTQFLLFGFILRESIDLQYNKRIATGNILGSQLSEELDTLANNMEN
jgi:hypothetical protein